MSISFSNGIRISHNNDEKFASWKEEVGGWGKGGNIREGDLYYLYLGGWTAKDAVRLIRLGGGRLQNEARYLAWEKEVKEEFGGLPFSKGEARRLFDKGVRPSQAVHKALGGFSMVPFGVRRIPKTEGAFGASLKKGLEGLPIKKGR